MLFILHGIFENVQSHEETCEKLDMFPEIVCVSLITQQILTAIISLFHFSHHHHPGGLLGVITMNVCPLTELLSSQ